MPTIQSNDLTYASAVIRTQDNAKKYYLLGLNVTNGENCSDCIDVTGATNASPIEITTASAHGRSTGDGVEIFGVLGNPAANGSWQVTVMGNTKFTLDNSTGNGTYTSGGKVTRNPAAFSFLVYVPQASTEDIVIDRCLIHGRGFPYRLRWGALLHGARMAVVNSSIYDIAWWQGVNPVTKATYGDSYGPQAINLRYPGPFIVRNNYLEGHGILNFVEASFTPGTDQAYNITIQRNWMKVKEERRYPATGYPNPVSDGRYYQNRQLIELKWGGSVKIDGNRLEGVWTNEASPGNAILIMPASTGAVYGLSDYTITNNTISRSIGGLAIHGADPYNAMYDTTPSARYLIRNNLIYGIYRNHHLWADASYSRGMVFYMTRSGSDFLIEHNTFYDNRGSIPSLFYTMERRWTRWVARNNIWTLNAGDYDLGRLHVDDNGRPVTPSYPTGTLTYSNCLAAFQGLLHRGTGTNLPPSGFYYNVFIPGVRDTQATGAYDSTSTSLNYNKYSCGNPTSGLLKDFLQYGNVCVGNNDNNDGSETANQRFALVKFQNATPALANALDPSLDFRLRYDSPYKSGGANRASDGLDMGVDVDQLEAAQGRVKNVRALNVTATGATVSYLAPDSSACTVEHGASSDWGSGRRVSDGGGDRVRNVSLSGLSPGTTYFYHVLCAVEQPGGTFRTEP